MISPVHWATAANPMHAAAADERDRQTDTVSFHRPCSAYNVGSAKNQQNRAAKKRLRAQKQTHTETETKTENLWCDARSRHIAHCWRWGSRRLLFHLDRCPYWISPAPSHLTMKPWNQLISWLIDQSIDWWNQSVNQVSRSGCILSCKEVYQLTSNANFNSSCQIPAIFGTVRTV